MNTVAKCKEKTMEDKHKLSPNCSCGVNQVPRRSDSPMCLSSSNVYPTFLAEMSSVALWLEARACLCAGDRRDAMFTFCVSATSERQRAACVNLLQALQYIRNKKMPQDISTLRRSAHCIAFLLISCKCFNAA